MSSRIDDFIDEHREEFDDESPAPEIWSRIQEKMKPAEGLGAGKLAPVRALYPRRWMTAAAAAIVLAVSGWLYFALRPSAASTTETANTKVKEPAKSNNLPQLVVQPDSPSTKEALAAVPLKHRTVKDPVSNPDPKTAVPQDPEAEEMYHYTRLIELKHEELKSLKKDEPLLYKKFASDVNKLDIVYNTLKSQLPLQSNREQVIEAMIANLQLQIGLLNKQLKIIKQIKHSKQSAYEKAYKANT